MEWALAAMRGTAQELHHADLDVTGAVVYPMTLSHPAVVLGSTQPVGDLAVDTVLDLGIDVARRRSGGGLVLLIPGEHLWVDVVMPRTHPGWHDDVDRAARWMGERWRHALGLLDRGIGDVTVHNAQPVARDVGRQVCFGGIGMGEVLVNGRKLIGISQRRSRLAARFQCAVHLSFDPAVHVALVDSASRHGDLAARLRAVATLDAASASVLVERLMRSLADDTSAH